MADKYLNADGLTYYNQKINEKINGIAAAQGDGKSIVATDGKLAVSYGGQHIYAGEEVVYEFKSGNWEAYGPTWVNQELYKLYNYYSPGSFTNLVDGKNVINTMHEYHDDSTTGKPTRIDAPSIALSSIDRNAEYKIHVILAARTLADSKPYIVNATKCWFHEDLRYYHYYRQGYSDDIPSGYGFIVPTNDQPVTPQSDNYFLIIFDETETKAPYITSAQRYQGFIDGCFECIITKVKYTSVPIAPEVLPVDDNTIALDPSTHLLALKRYNNYPNQSVSFNDVYTNHPDEYSTCFNKNTIASGYSVAMGIGAKAIGASVAVGVGKVYAAGQQNATELEPVGTASFAQGVAQQGTPQVSEGEAISAYYGGFANGYGVYRSRWDSTGREQETTELKAYGKGAHAEGYNTQALHVAAHTSGNGTKSALAYQTVCGQVNKATTDSLFVVGNGTYGATELDRNESNALECRTTGSLAIGGSLIQNASDYAECFEWDDGNKDKEDRIGYIVTLEGNKIRFADSTDDILGIISGTAGVIGNAAELDWKDRYLTDEYGRIIYDEIELEQTTCDPNDPEKEIVETIRRKVPRINPDFDSTLEYVPRTERPEWGIVGLMGQIYVRDNGLAIIGGYVTPTRGIATPSLEPTRMRVMERINDHIIRVFFK